jgi:hypothetical protein
MSEWGTPMVNASDTANFYCWSDAYSGIMAGWKRPDTGQLVNANRNIHWSVGCTQYSAQHPSMNPYSRYMRGEHENDCALVWQEGSSCAGAGLPHIFYTRLRIENGHIVNGLAPTFEAVSSDTLVAFNADTTILHVSYRTINPYNLVWCLSTFPVVYREIYWADTNTSICNFEHYYPGYNRTSFRFDNIYWQNRYESTGIGMLSGVLNNRVVRFIDTIKSDSFIPESFFVGSMNELWSSYKYLDHPVVSAGEAYNYGGYKSFYPDFLNCFNFSDRSMNLNFRSRPMVASGSGSPLTFTIIDSIAQIIHFPQPLFVEQTEQSVSIVDVGRLSYPHLAERGSLYQNDWQRNHRIYTKQDSFYVSPRPAPSIRSSGQYFFKTTQRQPIARQFHGFGDDSLSFGIATVTIGEREYPLKSKPPISPFDVLRTPDTLSTEWFTVDNIETMDIVTTGSSPERVHVWLERQSDGTMYDIPLTAGAQLKIQRETIELLNGDDAEYRLRLCRQEHAPYHGETAISEDDEEIVFGKRSGSDNTHIDLGISDPMQTIFIYPNPAREEVHLSISGTERSEVIIISALGGEVMRFSIDGGRTSLLTTSSFLSGVYAARVRRVGTKDVVLPFVIVR